jgi:hypothetical protein
MRRRQSIGIFGAFNEGEITWPGEIYWSDIRDKVRESRSIAKLGACQRDDFGYRQALGVIKETVFPHFSILDHKMARDSRN